MKALKIYLFLFINIVSSMCFAQNAVEETNPLDLIKVIGPQNIVPNFSINPTQISSITSHSNNIYIDQIGSNNTIRINAVTQRSNIDLIQNGNSNTVRLNFSALSAAETIQQQGDNHHLAAFGNTPSLNLQRTVNQEGYGQKLIIHGSNSLSEKIQLNMKGAASTIIIRNFN